MKLSEISSPEFSNRISELCDSRPDVETLKYMLGDEGILEWAHSVGVSTDPLLRNLAPDIPPHDLRSMVAASSEAVFLWTGLRDAQMCARYFESHRLQANRACAKILDFGCGCGRTARFLSLCQRYEVHGTDVNPDLVFWCNRNLKRVVCSKNSVHPTLRYKNGEFDFVYSLSIFTHLSEASIFQWLDELARVTVDNGIVLITTHGLPAIEKISESIQHQQMFQLSEDSLSSLQDDFLAKQYLFVPLSEDIVRLAKAGDNYGNCFIHESYIRSCWGRDVFEVVDFIPGGMRGWQDVTILRRLPRL